MLKLYYHKLESGHAIPSLNILQSLPTSLKIKVQTPYYGLHNIRPTQSNHSSWAQLPPLCPLLMLLQPHLSLFCSLTGHSCCSEPLNLLLLLSWMLFPNIRMAHSLISFKVLPKCHLLGNSFSCLSYLKCHLHHLLLPPLPYFSPSTYYLLIDYMCSLFTDFVVWLPY